MQFKKTREDKEREIELPKYVLLRSSFIDSSNRPLTLMIFPLFIQRRWPSRSRNALHFVSMRCAQMVSNTEPKGILAGVYGRPLRNKKCSATAVVTRAPIHPRQAARQLHHSPLVS